jgi:hypothetical protein
VDSEISGLACRWDEQQWGENEVLVDDRGEKNGRKYSATFQKVTVHVPHDRLLKLNSNAHVYE